MDFQNANKISVRIKYNLSTN